VFITNLRKIPLLTIPAHKVLLIGVGLDMSPQPLPHEKFLSTPVNVAHKLRLRVVVQVRPQVVDARKQLATEFARHVLVVVRLDVLLEVLGRVEGLAADGTDVASRLFRVLRFRVGSEVEFLGELLPARFAAEGAVEFVASHVVLEVGFGVG
jgi:hypothetical protein